jgi:prepilin-type N-terminal cleavage/methylation domain-containing protein/prepilin-type processing-associated H-X9-DG protein
MATRYRAAFTLVELLVVVAIIGVLVGLLMPAVLAARERARLAECMNHQGELGKAMISYDLAKKRLPGYANLLRGRVVSWAPLLLPYIGRNDLWEGPNGNNGWGRTNTPDSSCAVSIKQFVCPSDTTTVNYPLSYVVNIGQGRTPAPTPPLAPLAPLKDAVQYGLFRNYSLTVAKQISLTDVKSASRRPMIAESAFDMSRNLSGAGGRVAYATTRQWTDMDVNVDVATPNVTSQRFGFLFWPGGPSPTPFNPVVATRNPSSGVIKTGAIVPIHNGLLNVTFCDGHTESISNDPDDTCDKYDWADIK